MARPHVLVNSLAVSLFGVMSLWSSHVFALDLSLLDKDQSVCYQRTEPPITASALRINVKKHSPLTTFKEKKVHNHPIQTTYSVHGKSILGGTPDNLSYASVYGTVTMAKKEGARMAFTRTALLTPVGSSRIANIAECQSREASATPATWICQSLIIEEGQLPRRGTLRFDRIDNPLTNPACSFFGLSSPG